jgi:cytochrome c
MAAVGALFILLACRGREDETATPPGNTAATPAEVGRGELLYEHNCRTCHGDRGTGTDHGPPLVNRIYEPAHHDDDSFQLAVAEGAAAHHWQFGDMPPVPGVSAEEVTEIVRYVRWLQRQAGIF